MAMRRNPRLPSGRRPNPLRQLVTEQQRAAEAARSRARLSSHDRRQPLQFPDARNVMSFVDGHVSYIKIYWNGVTGGDGFPVKYEPPDGYEYRWSGN